MNFVSKQEHADAVQEERDLSRIAQRLQMAVVDLRGGARWLGTIRREYPDEERFADYDDRLFQLLDDVERHFQDVRDRLLKAREVGAKPVSTKV